jgi:hypothetical protein
MTVSAALSNRRSAAFVSSSSTFLMNPPELHIYPFDGESSIKSIPDIDLNGSEIGIFGTRLVAARRKASSFFVIDYRDGSELSISVGNEKSRQLEYSQICLFV